MAQGLGGFLGGLFGAGQPQQPQAQQPGSLNADPMQGLGFLQRMQYLQQNNPQALMALGSGMMQGNIAGGFAAAGDQMAQHRTQMAEQQKQAQQQNMTKRWLMANKGLSEQDAEVAISNPQILSTYLKGGDGQGIINAGAGNLYNSDTKEWLSAPGGGAEGVAGLVPVWLQDEQGNPVLGQMTKDGKVIRSEIDQGLTPVGPYQKSFETQRGAKEGEAVGTAAGALPGVATMAANVSKQVDDLKNDPYLPRMLGPVDSRLPNVSSDAARVQSKINQIQGGAFLQARQMLKGGGAITDYEGQKAEQAYARLAAAQGEADFKAALDEFNFYVQQGLQKLQAQAGQTRMGPGSIPAPGAGNDYKSRYGLD